MGRWIDGSEMSRCNDTENRPRSPSPETEDSFSPKEPSIPLVPLTDRPATDAVTPDPKASAHRNLAHSALVRIREVPLWRWPLYVLPVFLFAALALLLGFQISRGSPLPGDDLSGSLPRIKVGLTNASYSGHVLPNDVNQFLGIRYAKPPTGERRWRAPEPPEPQGDVQPATAFGATCFPVGGVYPMDGHSEDCLYLNVWAPSDATNSSKLPVWVYIQGGGYHVLSNWDWDGSESVAKSGNVVFVTLNYRVGIFGFLASDKIRQDGDLNAGLLDQRLALHWVRDNIEQFGGDPDHVVIHGASAGAGSVAMHLLAYGGRDDELFAGAMVDATFFPPQPRYEDLEYQFEGVTYTLECRDADDPLACLRGKDTAKLQRANDVLPRPGRKQAAKFTWSPCVDREFIRDYPYLVFEKGDFVHVPMMVGTSTDEGSVFADNAATEDEFVDFMRNQYPALSDDDADEMLELYPEMDPLPRHAAWFPSASLAYGEATFVCPSNTILNALITASLNSSSSSDAADNSGAASLVPAWSFRFNVEDDSNSEAGLGVPHVFDAAAFMGVDMVPTPESYYSYNAPVVPLMTSYYNSFVRELDPNPHRMEGAPEWDSWGSNRTRLVFERGGEMDVEQVGNGQTERCTFWERTAEETEMRRRGHA